jgi:hypothetical protein
VNGASKSISLVYGVIDVLPFKEYYELMRGASICCNTTIWLRDFSEMPQGNEKGAPISAPLDY